MNCRTVSALAIAVGVCFLAATVQTASANTVIKHGFVVAVTVPVPAAGKNAAIPGSIQVTESDQKQYTYPLAEKVSVMIAGGLGDVTKNVAVNDWVGLVIEDGKITVITNQFHKEKGK